MQSSNGDVDIENKLMDKGRQQEGEGEMNGQSSTDAYTLPYVKQTADGKLLCDSEDSDWGSVTTQRGRKGVGGWKEVKEEGDTCIPMADSCWCMADANTIL